MFHKKTIEHSVTACRTMPYNAISAVHVSQNNSHIFHTVWVTQQIVQALHVDISNTALSSQ